MTTPAQPSTVHLNGADLAFVELGSGDPVVFVHGSLGDYRSWGVQIARFGERHRAIAYSRRFHWPNAEPGAGAVYSISQHAADLVGLIEALGVAPVHLVGSSYGALTALTAAVERPDVIRSLVLGEPPLLPWLTRLPEGAALLETFLTTAMGPAGEAFARGEAETGIRLFLDGVLGAGAFDHLPLEARMSMLDNAPEMRAETSTSPETYFPDLSAEDVGRLHAPTLLLQGELSPPMFGIVTDELARVLPRAERATIAAASHVMHARSPADYNQVVLTFLADH